MLTVLISFPIFGYGSQGIVDSLNRELQKSKDPIGRGWLYLKMSELHSTKHPDSVIFYCKLAESEVDKPQKKYTKKQNRDRTEIIATAFNNIGFAYSVQGKMTEALHYNRKSLALWEQLNDVKSISKVLNNIGVLYRSAGDFDKAKEYYDKALKKLVKEGDTSGIALCHNNLAGIYREKGDLRKALGHYKTAVELRTMIGDRNGLAATLNNIGALYRGENKLDSSSIYFSRSLEIVQSEQNSRGVAHASYNLAEVEFERKNYERALELAELSLENAKKINGITNLIQASGLLAKIYEVKGDWQKAYQMQRLCSENTEKVKNEELNRELIKGEIKNEYDKQIALSKKESEKKLEIAGQQEKIQNYFTFGISFILVLVVLFIFILAKRLKTLREQKETIEKQNNERKGLLQEIHHRVKNNFQIISSLLKLQSYNHRNKVVADAFNGAINRIHAMAMVHEIIYKQGTFTGISAKVYLTSLVDNLKDSFANDKLNIQVKAFENDLDSEHFIPIGIIINELITNSYQHAFTELKVNPTISITLRKEGKVVELVYKDNGKGYAETESHDAFGMDLIRTMVEQLSGKMKFSTEGEWTTVFSIEFED